MARSADKFILEIQAQYNGSDSVRKLQRDLNAIDDIQGFDKQKDKLKQLETELQAAQERARRFGDAMMHASSEAASKNIEQHWRAAEREVSRLSGQLDAQRARVSAAASTLNAYGMTAQNASLRLRQLQAATQQAAQAAAARNVLGISNHQDVTSQIQQMRNAYAQLRQAGNLSWQAQAQASLQLTRRIQELRQQTNGWTQQLANMKGSLLALTVGWGGATMAIRGMVGGFVQFEDAMLRVKALSGASQEDYAALTKKAEELGATTRYTAAEAAAGLGQLAAAGQNTQQMLSSIGPALDLAAAGGSDLGVAADQLTNIMSQFGLQADQASRVADTLVTGFTGAATTLDQLANAMLYAGPQANALGYSLENTTAILQTLADAGYKGEKAGTALRGAFAHLLKQPKEAAEILEKYNINIADSTGKMRPFADILDELAKKQEKIRGTTEAAAEVLALFGTEAGSAMQALLSKGGDAIRKYEDILNKAGGTARKKAQEMESGLGGSLRAMNSAVEAFKNAFGGQVFAPVLKVVAQVVGEVARLAAEMPVAVKSVLVLGTAAVGVVASISTMTLVWKTFLLMLATSKASIVAAVGALGNLAGFLSRVRAGMMALSAAGAANPVLLGIIATLGLATVAYKTFAKSAHDASLEHAAAAERIGQSIEADRNRIEELKNLQKTLLSTAADTREHTDAEARLAKILPGANLYLGEQNQVLARLGQSTDENNRKLEAYIATLEGKIGSRAAVQLEELAKAFYRAREADEEFKVNTRAWYGFGSETPTGLQNFWRELNRLTGTYDKNMAKGEEFAANLEKQRAAFEDFLRSMAQSGKSADDVGHLLSGIHLDEGTKGRIVADYKNMLKQLEAEAKQAGSAVAAGAKESEKQATKYTEEELKERQQQYKKYAEEVQRIEADIAGRQKSLQAELREMGRSGMSDYDAWQDRKKEAEEYMAASRAAAEAARQAMAQGDTITAGEQWKAAVALADDAKAAYKSLNTEVKQGDTTLISKADALKQAMSGVKEAGELGIDALKEQQKSIGQAMQDMEKNVGLDKLTAGMDEAEKKWLESWRKMGDAASEAGAQVEQVYKVWKNAAGFWTNTADAFSAGWSRTADKGRVEFDGMWADFEKTGKKAADDVSQALDRATKARTVKIYTQTIEKRALGGPIGAARLARGGRLPGFGGGDRIPALLEAGEYVIRKEAVSRFGAGLFDALNRLRLPDLSALLPIPAPVAAAGGGRSVNINLSLGGDTFQMQTDEHTAKKLERWYSLRSSNRVSRTAFRG